MSGLKEAYNKAKIITDKQNAQILRRQALQDEAAIATIQNSFKSWAEINFKTFTFFTIVIGAILGAVFQWLTGLLPQL